MRKATVRGWDWEWECERERESRKSAIWIPSDKQQDDGSCIKKRKPKPCYEEKPSTLNQLRVKQEKWNLPSDCSTNISKTSYLA